VRNEPAYICRHPPNATSDALTTGTPWDALDQYEAVLARGHSDELAAAILRHGLTLQRRLRGADRPRVPGTAGDARGCQRAQARAARGGGRRTRPREAGAPRGEA